MAELSDSLTLGEFLVNNFEQSTVQEPLGNSQLVRVRIYRCRTCACDMYQFAHSWRTVHLRRCFREVRCFWRQQWRSLLFLWQPSEVYSSVNQQGGSCSHALFCSRWQPNCSSLRVSGWDGVGWQDDDHVNVNVVWLFVNVHCVCVCARARVHVCMYC